MCRTLARHGQRGWVVGGCLRDLLRGVRPADWDLATDARPEQVQAIFSRVIPTGIQHGTVTVRQHGVSYEVTTLRGEGAYSDGRRPDSVFFVTDIVEDLARRDFTINALAYDPVADRLEDPFSGLNDLEQRVIRAVGDPKQRFAEDGLRVLRAARFAATLEFTLDGATEQAIATTLDTFGKISAERVREEWCKALRARTPSRAFAIMQRSGILGAIYPQLAALETALWQRTLEGVDACRAEGTMRLAALLFPRRSELAEVAAWLARYRFSNAERERVLHLLTHAEPPMSSLHSDLEVRRHAQRIGRGALDEVTEFGELMARAHSGSDSSGALAAAQLRARCRALITPETPLHTRELALGGRELMAELGMAPGPRLGELLEQLLDRALVDPSINTRARLLEAARALRSEE
jgi:tRNA nucleotidyltransferase (CCA-adding enzyme)